MSLAIIFIFSMLCIAVVIDAVKDEHLVKRIEHKATVFAGSYAIVVSVILYELPKLAGVL